MDAAVKTRAERDEISLKELIETLRRGRCLIAAVTMTCVLAAAAAALLLPKTYQATALLSPVSNSPSEGTLSSLGSLASQFSGLASLAGLSLSTDSKRAEAVAFLESDALARKYIEDNHLLPVLYADRWDPGARRWRTNKAPTLWEATRKFEGIRTVKTDSKTGLVRLTIKWRDPKAAAVWANDLVEMTNDYLRGKAIAQAERDIDYLKGEAEKTNIVEARQAIFTVWQTELNKSMLARGTDEYAFKVIDPAVAPERPSSPKPILWVAVAFCGGFLLASFLVLLFSALR